MSVLPDISCKSLSIKGKTVISSDRNITCKNITGNNIQARQNLRVGGWLPFKLLPITLESGVDLIDFRPTPDTLHLFTLPSTGGNTLEMLNESMAQYNLNINEGFQFSIGNADLSESGSYVSLHLDFEDEGILVKSSGLVHITTNKYVINTYALVRTSLTDYTLFSVGYINFEQ